MLKVSHFCGALCLGALLVGCGSSGPTTHKVTGRVTFEGQPVADGEIVFRAADGSEGSWAGKIVDGQYAFRSTPGEKRVEITATREVQAADVSGSGESVNFESYIPQKYNSQSELTANVTADGPNKFDFPLEP